MVVYGAKGYTMLYHYHGILAKGYTITMVFWEGGYTMLYHYHGILRAIPCYTITMVFKKKVNVP